MPWRLIASPIAAGMVAHAARWALISVTRGSAPTGAFVACMLVAILATPVVDRAHLPFAAVALSAVISLMPCFFPVQRRDGPRRIGLDRVGRAGSADEHRNERRMEAPTLNEVRNSLGGIGDAVHELPPLSTSDGSRLTDLDASNRRGRRIFLRFNRITGVVPAARCSASVNGKVRRK